MNKRKILKRQLGNGYRYKRFMSAGEAKALLSKPPKTKHEKLYALLTVGCVKINAVLFPTPSGMTFGCDILVKDHPDSRDMHEYKDYSQKPTMGNASEFISRAVEDNSYEAAGREGYAKYIALRPRAEKIGTHGLFTDDGVEVNLSKVADEMNVHRGNIWTIIISLRCEDAERLGFDTGDRWRTMLRTQTANLSENFKIPMKNLRWYGAFHNESHHPHVHMIVYSTNENEGYLSKKGIENLRAAFAKDIFMQDMYCTYEKQTEYRDRLRADGRQYIADIVEKINTEQTADPQIKTLLLQLADRLSRTKGKKVYGYLKPDVKNIVDSILIELSKDERIQKLYDLWYQQKENNIKIYTDNPDDKTATDTQKSCDSVKTGKEKGLPKQSEKMWISR